MVEQDDPDSPLVEAARAGDERAMEQLFRRHIQAVFGYALRATADRTVAEDIAQETFIRGFRAIGRFDGRSSFRTWLFAIAINRTRTHLRRFGGARKRVEVPLEEDTMAVEAPISSSWTRKRLALAMAALPEGYREAVIMHDVLDMEHQEIAAARGCTVGTSKSQLHKARAKLRELLGPREGPADA